MSISRRTALSVALTLALAGAVDASATQLVAAASPSPDAIEVARSDSSLLILRAGIFDPSTQALDAKNVGAAADATSSYAIVQFKADRIGEHKSLARQGVQILGYVPNNAYYVRLNGVKLADIAAQPAVRWAGAVQPSMKLDPTLWVAKRHDSVGRREDNTHEIMIEGFAGVSSAQIAAALEKSVPGVKISMRSLRAEAAPYVRAVVQDTQLDALLRVATGIEGVAFVSPWAPTVTTNAGGIAALQGNLTTNCTGSGPVCGPAPLFDHNITGSGQIVAVADSGTSPNSAFFTTLDKGDGSGPHTEVTFADVTAPIPPAIGQTYPNNKIFAYWTQPGGPVNYDLVSGHGTHTTGTVLGDASGTFSPNTFMPSTPILPNHELADGMAPNAQLLMQDIGGNSATAVIVQDFAATLEQAHTGGARIHSDSWGGGTSGAYTADDAAVDLVSHRKEDLLVIIAAGNDQSGAMATGSPGNAKNAVTVAALGHAGSLTKASFSNAGPTADGRLKPDVAAPGSSTISALNNTSAPTSTPIAPQTRSNSGTSMATPTVAGNVVLQRQFFTDGFYPRGAKTAADKHNPTGPAMKAILLNGTRPTTSPATFPNTGTGWGRVWLDNNLWFNGTMTGGDDSRRLRLFERTNAAGLATGETNEYTIANVGAGIEFRATLTWFDPEASAGAASTLVNNLDLEVVDPNGQTLLGNRFVSNVSAPGGTADTKDTVEQVRLTAPVAGAYTLRVKATGVPGNGAVGSDRQGYALAVSGKFGLPDTTAHPAPTALNVAANGAAGVSIGFTGSGTPQGYQLYRADGTCATANAGDFHLVGSAAASPIVDDHTQGGFSYAYKVRGISNDVEGDVSACVDVVSQDACTLDPAFDTQSLLGDGSAASCSAQLAWAAATASCPTATGTSYKVERDTNAYFTTPTVLAPAEPTTSYADNTVTNGTPYFYRVSAQDNLGNVSPATTVLNLTPSGVNGPDPATFLDDVDTHTYMTMELPWRITNTGASAGTYAYRNANDGQIYNNNTCASLEMPPLTIAAGASTLSFKAKYDLEYQWDGVVIEISTNNGATWNDLPPVGGYPNTFAQTGSPPANVCGYAASHGAFTGLSTAASAANPNNGSAPSVYRSFTVNLASFVGQNVRIRWRFASDPASEFDGFQLDEVKLGSTGPSDLIFKDGFDPPQPSGYVCQ